MEGNARSFVNHQQMKKHMDIHANIECPQCKKIFGAKRNMKRHVKNVHETHQGLNESDVEDNFNADPLHYGKVSMGGATYRILNF